MKQVYHLLKRLSMQIRKENKIFCDKFDEFLMIRNYLNLYLISLDEEGDSH